MKRGFVLVMAAVLFGSTGGCSYLFVRPLPESRERREGSCTTSPAAPVIDLGIAGWQFVRTLVALTASDAAYVNAPISRPADIGIGAGLLTLFGTSMVYGFSQTNKCREALAEDGYRPVPRRRPQGSGQAPSSKVGPAPSAQPWRVGPPPSWQRKQDEEEEEAAVQARAAARARAAREAARAADAGAASEPPADVPAVKVTPPAPLVPQRADPE